MSDSRHRRRPLRALRGGIAFAGLVAVAAGALAGPPEGGENASPRAIYLENCALCHGEDSRGVYGPDYYGPSLVGNGFVRGHSDAELIEFLKVGRPADAPTSTMHLLMPPAGYLPAESLAALVRFLRDGR